MDSERHWRREKKEEEKFPVQKKPSGVQNSSKFPWKKNDVFEFDNHLLDSSLTNTTKKSSGETYSPYSGSGETHNVTSKTNRSTYNTSPISGNSSKKNSATDKNLALWEPDDVRYTKDQRDTLKEYEKKYAGKVYKDNFWGQSQANYAAGSFMQDIYAAYNDYWNDPSDENWMYAQALEILQEDFVKRNAAALDNEGVVLPWLSQSAAGYLPQLQDQTVVSLNSAALGAGVGAGVGSVIPGLGTATGAIWGGRTGYVTGRTLHSREQMRGAAFRELLANGVDYETARKAAADESFVSALIESGDAILDVATLGGAKALPWLAKYGFNILGEGLEESAQEAVSIANENRTSTGVLDLTGKTVSTLWDAATGQNDDARNRIMTAGNEGAKIAVMFGGATTAVNPTVQSGGNYVGSTLNTISPQTSYSSGTPVAQEDHLYGRGYSALLNAKPPSAEEMRQNEFLLNVYLASRDDSSDMPLVEENASRTTKDPESSSDWTNQNIPTIQESDMNSIRRKGKSLLERKKVVAFYELPDTIKTEFRDGLYSADPEVQALLKKIYRSADYIIGDEDGSRHVGGIFGHTITVGKKATNSTIAHELFHQADKGRKLSRGLSGSLERDYASLRMQSGGDIVGYLVEQYPYAFRVNSFGDYALKKDYRGIADIINGLSKGEIWIGAGHPTSYWKDKGNLEAEAWAQFGRIYYANNQTVIQMFEEIFPNLAKKARRTLRGLI